MVWSLDKLNLQSKLLETYKREVLEKYVRRLVKDKKTKIK